MPWSQFYQVSTFTIPPPFEPEVSQICYWCIIPAYAYLCLYKDNISNNDVTCPVLDKIQFPLFPLNQSVVSGLVSEFLLYNIYVPNII